MNYAPAFSEVKIGDELELSGLGLVFGVTAKTDQLVDLDFHGSAGVARFHPVDFDAQHFERIRNRPDWRTL